MVSWSLTEIVRKGSLSLKIKTFNIRVLYLQWRVKTPETVFPKNIKNYHIVSNKSYSSQNFE